MKPIMHDKTKKKKAKEQIKIRDLKPAKDAKGGYQTIKWRDDKYHD